MSAQMFSGSGPATAAGFAWVASEMRIARRGPELQRQARHNAENLHEVGKRTLLVDEGLAHAGVRVQRLVGTKRDCQHHCVEIGPFRQRCCRDRWFGTPLALEIHSPGLKRRAIAQLVPVRFRAPAGDAFVHEGRAIGPTRDVCLLRDPDRGDLAAILAEVQTCHLVEEFER